MPEVRWIQVTTLGSRFEEQMSECGRYWRHRALSHGSLSALTGDVNGEVPYADIPWQPGRAPAIAQPPVAKASSVPSIKRGDRS